MPRTSIYSINQILILSHKNSAFHSKPFLNLNNFIPISAFSSSSLQAIQDSESKSISNPLYHLLPQTQNPNNIVNLICSNLKQNTHLPVFQNELKGLLPHLGSHEISRVLLRFQSDSSSALTFFNWVKNDLNLRPTIQNYCIIVHILTWSRKFSQAMNLLCELIEMVKVVSPDDGDVFGNLVLCGEDCNWDPVVFDMLIKAYVKANMVEQGFGTFRKSVEVGFVPSVVACNCLLNGLVKLRCVDRCWEVYEEMGRIGIHPNAYTFNMLINVLCKDQDVDKVNEFIEKMEEEGFDPDVVTYNTLINSYCRKGRLGDAFYLYKIMYRRGALPDLFSYTALMNGLCKEGKVREAHQLFHRMVHRGLSPDTMSYNTLICGYCKEGKMKESRSLLYEMIGNGVRPDSFTCRVVVEGYGNESKLLSALNLLSELERFEIPISPDIYEYLVFKLCEENRPFAAKSLLERISQYGYVPDIDVYNELILSLCKCNYVAEALSLKAEMVNKNIKPNLVTYRALIACLCEINKSMEEGECVMKEMVKFGVPPDTAICKALINGYCKEMDINRAESLLGFFAREFQIFDTESYNALVKVLSENADVATLMELQDRMQKVGFAPNNLTCKFVIDGLWKATTLDKNKLNLECM